MPADSVSIDVSYGETLTIELSPTQLDPDPSDIIEVLTNPQQPPVYWNKIASAYLRAGLIDGAEKIVKAGLKLDSANENLSNGNGDWSTWSLLAAILAARARDAPKMVYAAALEDIHPHDAKTRNFYYKQSATCLNQLAAQIQATDELKDSAKRSQLVYLTRGIQQMSVRQMDDALKTFDLVLKTHPNNVVAIVAKAKILYLKKSYIPSLKLFQKALQLSPSMSPDPRIGIGLCLWALGHEDRAIKAWERAAEMNTASPSPQALIGLAYLNVNRIRGEKLNEHYRRDLIVNGTKHIQNAFQLSSQKSAASADVLAEVFLKRSAWNRALKLSERTIQFADTLSLLTEGYVRAGRVCFNWAESVEKTDPSKAKDLRAKATKYFGQALEGQPRSIAAGIGLAACQLLNEESSASITSLDNLILRTASSSNTSATIPGSRSFIQQQQETRNIESATLFLAALRAFPRPGASSKEIADDSAKARLLLERAGRTIGLAPFTTSTTAASAASKKDALGESVRRWIDYDKEMFVEVARLWWAEPGLTSSTRTRSALNEALRVEKAMIVEEPNQKTAVDPRLVNNVAVLSHLSALDMDAPISAARRAAENSMRKDLLEEARTGYSQGLMTFSSSTEGGGDVDAGTSTMLYNLARVYEDAGEENMAKEAYEKLLGRHNEYIDAKIRLASLYTRVNKHNDAHDLLKQALSSAPANLNLRAYYVKFLMDAGLQKPARDFLLGTLKEHDKHDVWSLVAFGWVVYTQARESRDTSSKGVEERKKSFVRAAELFEKALQLDPSCAHAAQGLAICTAEDALSIYNTGLLLPLPSGQAPTSGDEQAKRVRNAAREALDIFAKVRESISEGSVYFNMGHCYYARDEFDRAIESYETASTRFWNNQNVSGLLCLCRSWYAKAMKDQSYRAITTALQYAQKALFLQPNDKAILYNIAMIQQKSAEMLFTIPPQKRALKDLTRVIDQARHAQTIFGSLAADKSSTLPYSRDIADQRRKYGDNMLRRGDEHLAKQQEHEAETQAKLEAARQKRQEDRDKAEEAKRERLEQLRIQNEKLAEERRLAREQVQAWTREAQLESDEEKERKEERKEKRKREKKEKKPVVSGDEDEVPTDGEKAGGKKRTRKSAGGRLKKGSGAVGLGDEDEDEDAAVFTDDEDEKSAPPPKPRPSKKRVVRDDDEEEKAVHAPRKKQFKSKEILSDTDDEDEVMAPPPQEEEEPKAESVPTPEA